MAKKVQIIEAEQIQQLIEDDQKAQKEQHAEMLKEAQAMNAAIINMSPNEIADFIDDYLSSSNVVIEALNLVETYNMGDAILVSALGRARQGLDAAILWIENHFSIGEEQASEEQTKNKTESPKPQKEGKRIVYGAGVSPQAEDDSEQL